MASRISGDDYALQIGMQLDTQSGAKQVTNFLKNAERISVIKTRFEFDGKKFEKEIETFKDKYGNLLETSTINKFKSDWHSAKETVTSDISSITTMEEQYNRSLQETADVLRRAQNMQEDYNRSLKNGKTVLRDFTDTFLKMIKFNTINMIYDGIINSFRDAIRVTKEFNDATTELRKVSELSGDSLREYAQDLAKYGEEVGRSMTDMVNSAVIFKRTGATDEEAKELAKISEMYRNVADSEISSAEASSFLVSQMKAFNMTAEESIHIIDAVNKTANEHAASTDDLQKALTKSASALATAGNSYEQTISLIESGVAVMQGQAGTVGNGLRTIAINVANLATKNEELVVANGKLTVSLKESNGEIRSTYDILADLAKGWDKLTRAEQNEVAVSLAGKTRYNVLTSILRNFADAQASYEGALNSTNSAMEENARYMESIQAKMNNLSAEYQKFILGDGGLEKLEKIVLDLATSFMQLVNKAGSLKTILSALGTVIAVKMVSSLNLSKDSFIKLIATVEDFITTNTVAVKELIKTKNATEALKLSTFTMSSVLGALTAVIGIAITAYNGYIAKQKQVRDEARELVSQTLDQVDATNEQIAKLQDETLNRGELESAIKQVDSAYDTEGKTLDELNKKRQEAIDKIKEEKKEKLEEAKNKGWSNYKTALNTMGSGYTSLDLKGSAISVQDVNSAMGLANKYGIEFDATSLKAYTDSLAKLTEYEQQNGLATQKLSKLYTEAKDLYDETKKTIDDYNNVLSQLYLIYDSSTGKVRKMTIAEVDQLNAAKETQEQLDEFAQYIENIGVKADELKDKLGDEEFANLQNLVLEGDLDSATELLEKYGIAVENTNEQLTEFEEIVSDFIGFTQDAQKAYETLSKACDEYNEKGYITASTLANLAKLQPEYATQLDIVNGKMVLTNGALQEQFETEKQLAIANLNLAEQQAIVSYCQQQLEQDTSNATTEMQTQQTEADTLAGKLLEVANAGVQASYAMALVAQSGKADEDFYKGIQNIRDTFAQYREEVSAMNLDYSKSSRSGGGGGGSSKDPWVEAFEREKKDLKHKLEMNEISEKEYYDRLKELNEKYFGEISGKHQKYLDKYRENEEEAYKGLSKLYEQVKQDLEKQIEDGYEDAINALKDEEKKAVKEVEQSIKALKAEKDKVLDGIQDQIDALKDEKDSVEEYWNNQINLIKQENNVLQQQNELLQKQQELQQAKQKKVMVVKDGRFQLTEDESEVAKAEQNLSNYQDQLSYEQQIQEMEDLRDAQVKTIEDRIKSLEEYKDYMQDYYDNQIEQMESYKDKLEEQYEAQIEALQKQLDVFKEGAKQLENIENGKLQAQVLATDEEAMNYETRLKNLKNYINEYNRLLTQLGVKGAQVDTAYSPIKGLHTPISIATSASGTASVDKDGLMLVGESPNTELLIGSNLNNSVNSGQFVKLRRGDGVVNAESTSTLAGMLNMMQTPQQNSISKTTTQHFAFGNITLPNVKDGDSFVRTLSQKFNNYSIQVSNNRA